MGGTGTPGAVGSHSAPPREQVGISGAFLKGTSSVDEESAAQLAPIYIILLTGRDSNQPPFDYRSNSLTSVARMATLFTNDR